MRGRAPWQVLINGLFKGFGHKKKLKEGGAAAEMPTEGSLPDMGQRLQVAAVHAHRALETSIQI
jgi:hypothetical protein